MQEPVIYIIGAGAIGKALAVFLRQENKKVILVRGSIDNKPEKTVTISVTISDNRTFRQEITTTTFANLDSIGGIVLITAKSFANQTIAEKLGRIKGSFPVVLLQNGLNIEQPFQSFGGVYRCVLFSTAQLQEENTVTFKSVTESPVGKIKGKSAAAENIVAQISTPPFGFRSEPDILKYVWEKVIANCAFNSVCPLLETDNGIFRRNPGAARLARIIIDECVAVAEKYNIKLDKTAIAEKLMLISEKADGQLISTYEDIRKGRRTEIDSLNLEIARLADEAGAPGLVTNTRLLGELIRIKSEIHSA